MGWRDSYDTLLELFPQVDARLIKGAALEHGNDVGAAAEFILNDVLGAEEETSDSGHPPDTTVHHCSCFDERPPTAGEEQVIPTDLFDTSVVDDLQQDEHDVVSMDTSEGFRSSESNSGSAVLRITTEPEVEELTGESPNENDDGLLTMTEMGERVEPEVTDALSGGSTELVEEDELGLANIVRQIFLMSRRKKDGQARTEDTSTPLMSAEQESVRFNSGGMVDYSTESPSDAGDTKVMEADNSEIENSEVFPFDSSNSNTTLAFELNPAVYEHNGTGEAGHIALADDESLPEFPSEESELPAGFDDGQGLESVFDQYSSQMQRHKEHVVGLEEAESLELMPLGSQEEYTTKNFTDEEFPVYDESIIARPAYDEDELTLNDGLDSMMSIQKSAISEEMDRADWENVNCIAVIQMNQMEPLDNLVEEAKADKEALIVSIEEIRVLRLMTDQAEYAARQSREEAARGGLDVMAKVNEMRKMLSRAREANAMHAGEVFGEKAVLATEARELQHRLAQVNSEKAKSVAALNEIKASLQARIEIAFREREAADEEKIEKELRAKEALAKEEIILAKVAQESRDLDAEAEDCKKIREFLIERGSIVDALQGEVAVLREDAESLKKDLESMSLSFSGFHANMSSHASDIYNSIVSGSGKLSESYGQPSQDVVTAEGGAIANSSSEPVFPSRTASAVLKATSDRKSWSSLPSLLRGLSGSQDLNGSSHSSYSSTGSNALSSSRSALDVNESERSQLLGSEKSMTDTKFPSSPNSPTSPAEKKQEERELLKAKMAMFPGEELEMEYLGVHNLDVFRSEKPIGSGGDTDEEGWQVLEKVISRTSSRSSGDK